MAESKSERHQKFHITPKTHKENNPGRPIINSFNCHTPGISRLVDHNLQPLVKEIPSYIKDNQFVNKITILKLILS